MSPTKGRNHLRERLWAAWASDGQEVGEGDLAAIRQYLLQRGDIKDDLMAWDTSPERERRIKMAIADFLSRRTTRFRALPSMVDLLYQTIASFGPLDLLLKDEQVTNILVNDWDQVYFDRMGEGQNIRLERAFQDPAQYRTIFHRIVTVAGGVINAEEPCVDLMLPYGTRVNASMPPYTRSYLLSLRLFRRKRFSLADLQAMDTFDDQVRRYIGDIVKARANVIVGGAVGTGKTTLINAALSLLPPSERLVTAEDAPELRFEARHWVAHYTRSTPAQGSGRRYDLRFVVRDMLRKKADRIVVGEVRGPEALDMLLAMNAGTCGWSSCHGHSSQDVLSRLCTFALLASENLKHQAIQDMVASVVDVVIMMGRCGDGKLRVVAVEEVAGMADGGFEVSPIFRLKEEAGGSCYTWEQANESRLLPTSDEDQREATSDQGGQDGGIMRANATPPLARAIDLASQKAQMAAGEGDEAEAQRLSRVVERLATLCFGAATSSTSAPQSRLASVEAAL